MLDEAQEPRLGEIRALIGEADQRLQSVVELLERIEEPERTRLRPRRRPGRWRNGAAAGLRAIKAHHRQAPPPEHPLIAFVHIPKTAGGTVTTMFSAAWGKKCINKTGNYVSGPEKTVGKVTKRPGGWEAWLRRGGRVAIGHTPYGVFDGNVPEGTCYITFLREPVDRVISHYYRHVHQRALAAAGEGSRGLGGKAVAGSLREALLDMSLPQLNNLATRFLCSHPTLERLPDSAIDEAKENLRGFALVGIQERFEESVILLQRAFDLGLVPTLDRHVSAPGGRPTVDELSQEDRELIEEHNAFDVELYRYGLELFEEAAAAAGESLAADAERLRAANVAAAEEHRAAIKAIRAWFDVELPPGTSKPIAEMLAQSDAAGFSRAVFNTARRDLLVRKEQNDKGVWMIVRPAESELAALRQAQVWLERELPSGASLPAGPLGDRAEAAGLSRMALNRARKLLDVAKTVDDAGQVNWTRPDEDAG
jgi:hypothetical protein